MLRIHSAAILLCAALLSACAATPDTAPGMTVLTYNIHHGRGTDGVIDLERQAQVILDANADLVALQEVDVGTGRSGGVDQAAELARLTGLHVVFGEAMPHDGGSYGEAVLSRWPARSSEVLPLPASPGHEPRAAVILILQPSWAATPLRVAATHLDHTDEDSDRLLQMNTLKRHLEKGALPTLLMGDLNATPDSAPMALLLEDAWTPADPSFVPTYPAASPEKKIDWILMAPASSGRLVNAQVLRAPLASDHAPLVARWEFP